MRTRTYLDLVIVVAVTFVTAALVVAYPDWQSPVRVALGMMVVLLAPGYVLTLSLFARRDDVDGVERLALTLGLSIAAVPLLGLVLNWSPWGIRQAPMAIALAAWVAVFAALAGWRRSRAVPGTAFEMPWGTTTMRQGTALFAGVMLVLLGVPALAVALRPPNVYTEFYVLGSTGQLQSYPTRLEAGERFELTFGVGNFERDAMDYRIVATFDPAWELVTPLIPTGERWERTVELVAPATTGRTQLDFELHRFDRDDPYRSLRLFVTLPGPTVFPELADLELRPLVPIEPSGAASGSGTAVAAAADLPDAGSTPPPAAQDPATALVVPSEPAPASAAASVLEPGPATAGVGQDPAEDPRRAEEPIESSFRIHLLAPGETLFGLARTYLGNGNRYVEILELNREVIDDVTDIPVGTLLRIPAAP